jgi:hypothetical protein
MYMLATETAPATDCAMEPQVSRGLGILASFVCCDYTLPASDGSWMSMVHLC